MNVREIFTKWGFTVDTDKVHGFNRALGAAKGTATFAAKAIAGIAAGAAAAGVGLVKLTANVAKGFDEVLKASQKVAVGTDTLQELKHAAELGDVPFAALTVGIRKFSDTTAQAAAGNKTAAASFKALGVAVKDNKGKLKDNDELLFETLVALADMPEGAKKTAAALDIFGRSGADLLPMLDGGSEALGRTMAEAKKLGLVFKKDALVDAAEFNDSMTRLKDVFTGVAGSIATELMPMFTDAIKGVQKWALANKDFIAGGIRKFISEVVSWLRELVKNGPSIQTVFAGMTAAVKGMSDGIAWLLKYKTEIKWFFLILVGLGVASKLAFITKGIWAMGAAVWGLVAAKKAAAAAEALGGVKVITAPTKGALAKGAAVVGGIAKTVALPLAAVALLSKAAGPDEARRKEITTRAKERGEDPAKLIALEEMRSQSSPLSAVFGALNNLARATTVADPREGSFLAPAGVGGGSKSQTATVQVTNNVTVPPGTPGAMAKQIADEAEKRMKTAVRSALEQLKGAT
jgi:hypothetical protein